MSASADDDSGARRPAGSPMPRRGAVPVSTPPVPERQAMPLPTGFEGALAHGFARRLAVLAERLGADAHSVRWTVRAAAAISRATAEGHVCVDLAELSDADHPVLDDVAGARAALLSSGVACDGAGPAGALLPLVIDAHDRIYLARYFDYERRLAWSLAQRALAPSSDPVPAEPPAVLLERYFKPSEPGRIDAQRLAAALALGGRLTIVSGGPGTGKTTTVVGMLAALLDRRPTLRVALAAPTGKAAQRLQEALGSQLGHLPAALAARLPRRAHTLHRLLGIGPDGNARYDRSAPLPFDVVIVDEASMIDVALAARLVDAVAPQARLVLLGDKDQLAAVEAGAVFAELTARQSLSAHRLADLAQALGVEPAALAHATENAPRDEAQSAAQNAGSSAADNARAAAGGTEPGALVDCVVWLQRNYRFGLESPIGRLATAIRDGLVAETIAALHPGRSGHNGNGGASSESGANAKSGESGDSASEEGATSGATLVEDDGAALNAGSLDCLAAGFAPYIAALADWLAALPAASALATGPAASTASTAADDHKAADDDHGLTNLFAALNRFCVLCAMRAGARGVDRLNLALAAIVRRAAGVAPAHGAQYGTQWFAGRVIMIKRNDYALGLFNGDTGIALPRADGALRVWFRTPAGGFRAVALAALPTHDAAFALTVHKAQGSEFEHVALVLPAAFNRVLTRELIYTAVTRARSRITLIGAAALVERAVATPTRRASGLAARLDEAAAYLATTRSPG